MGFLKKDSFGFTLIELAAVIVIIGVLAGMAYPSLHSALDHYRLWATANDIASAIRLVQQRSMDGEGRDNGRRSVYIFFSADNNYQIGSTPPLRPEKIVPLPAGIVFRSGTTKMLQFSSDGAPSPQGLTIIIENRCGERYEITVPPATGRVRIKRL